MPKVPDSYDRNVFINCPFDDDYKPVFDALIFAVFECGLRPRCALEVDDGGKARIGKIARIIRECRWGIHDISRTELTADRLPRFNMPLELGIFLGARWFGDRPQKAKSCLILDVERHRYQKFISDIAGQDIKSHSGDPVRAIGAVRTWLAASPVGQGPLPGTSAIAARFQRFARDLPAICARTDRRPGDLTFVEIADVASIWLRTARARGS